EEGLGEEAGGQEGARQEGLMAARRQRLDADLVRRGLVASRVDAVRLIELGRVLVNGSVADKPSRQVHPGDAVLVDAEPPRFVSRGGEKLDGALESFGVTVSGARALDIGASTGGFTDCLLQRGAAHVVALDVGHGQLHPRIRDDARVTVLEKFHVRDVTPDAIGGMVAVVVADVSFISVVKVLDPALSVLVPAGSLVLLVKPQFEAGRAEVSRGRGVITDPEVHRRVCEDVAGALEARGCTVRGWMESPIRGGDGNVEFLVHAVSHGGGSTL
ncbi:MAG: TlyA family RNA methyltransferase, partial [Ilumatobacteraceae bacterium]